MMKNTNYQGPACPFPISEYPLVTMAHGGGGKMMHQLIKQMFTPLFDNPDLESDHDGATLQLDGARLAFTTDSYVVDPIFFPGGDIGKLAVFGTVNDLAMCGARPLYLSASFIIEEGSPTETLRKIALSMRQAALQSGVRIVTGDTKVVNRGNDRGLFITTAGIGCVEHDLSISPYSVRTGDAIILSGDIGRHGIAVMTQREGFSFETQVESDCAPLWDGVRRLLEAGIEIHCLRDLTRGGLASALVEIAESSGRHLTIDEADIPVSEEVQAACEILGFDPVYVANEGRFVALVAGSHAERAAAILEACYPGLGPAIIGEVSNREPGLVTVKSVLGAERILDMLSGEQLPRIC